MPETDRRRVVLAGPAGANLQKRAYRTMQARGVPVRLVVTDQAVLKLVATINSDDWLFLLPELFATAEEAKVFLDDLPETVSVASAQPDSNWENSAEVIRHERVKVVFRRPLDFDNVAAALVELMGLTPAQQDGAPASETPQAAIDDEQSAPPALEPVPASTSGPVPASTSGPVPASTSEPAPATFPPVAPVSTPSLSPASPAPVTPSPAKKTLPASAPAGIENVLAVWSGMVGGTGKSTLTVNLALRLAQSGVSVILLAFGGSARHTRAGGDGAGEFLLRPDEHGFRDGLRAWRELPVMPAPADFRTMAQMGDMQADAPGSVAHLVSFAAGRYDLVIVDCPPGAGDWALQPLMAAGTVLLVSRPTVADQTEMARALNLLGVIRRGDNHYHTWLALNDAMPEDPDTTAYSRGLATVMGRQPPAVIARLPHHPNVRRAQNEALPLAEAEGLEVIAAGIESLAAPWLPPVEEDSRDGRQPGETPGRTIGIGRFKVKVVD